ncbi:energy-coupling factor ABC transporter ATP-binding protein [Limnochorda pilosa]|uniref:ABC transporter ATP-binding protein n=1 Tax=Limnochorda pilosa TaxID=1555112 RepID=A0A0K2SH98_LIMPI|nr:ATP-binding cassette domain-containing protein [Limnochorda pilosa]BAS26496.1 cobalt ABC transporter ATP-binding protein [Limnochorda pilosa]
MTPRAAGKDPERAHDPVAPTDPIIRVEDLRHTYPDGTPSLRGCSLRVEAGCRLAILGPNGAGKTTLLLHLNGLLLPEAGRVWVLGTEVGPSTCRQVRARVGYLFQEADDQLLAPTVWEDVAFGPANLGLSHDEVRRRAWEALGQVGASHLAHRAPHRLSQGEKRRVALAGVLAMQPGVILLDEPAASLDPAGVAELLAILDGLHLGGTTLVMATHDVDLAAEWADTVAIVEGGRVVAQGGRELLRDESVLLRARLRLPRVAAVFRDAEAPAGRAWPLTVPEGVRALRALRNGGRDGTAGGIQTASEPIASNGAETSSVQEG